MLVASILIRNTSISIKKLLRLKTYPKTVFNLLDYNLKEIKIIYKDSDSNVTLLEATPLLNRLCHETRYDFII